MAKIKEVPIPEHEKLKLIKDKSQAIGEFIEWLEHDKKIHLSKVHTHGPECEGWDPDRECYNPGFDARCEFFDGQLYFASVNIVDLLAEFFEIDRRKLEDEKLAMLEEFRTAQGL